MYDSNARGALTSPRLGLTRLMAYLRTEFNRLRWPSRRRTASVFLIAALLLATTTLAFITFQQPLVDFWYFLRDQEAVNAHFQSYGLWGPLLLAFYQVLQVIIAVIPGHALVVAGGYIYGFPLGLAVNFASLVVASQVAFYIARKAGRPLVNRLVPVDSLERWNGIARRHGTIFFMVSFILPGFPDDVMNFIAGMSPISGRQFLAANALGRLPSAILLTLIGSHGLQLPLLAWVGIIALVLLMLVGYRYAFRRYLAPYWNLEPEGPTRDIEAATSRLPEHPG